MGIFDRFKKSKQQKMVMRGYQGAKVDRLFADFMTSTRSPDSEIRPALLTLRNRSRDLSRNNEYARRYLNLLKTNVVGEHGVSMQVKAKNSDGSFDAPGNTIIENAWNKWCKRGNCTVDGRLSFVDAQNLFIQSLARDGEVLIRMVNYDNDDRFALEFLEPDVLDEQKNEITQDGNRIRMGVEINKYRKPLAYYILSEHPGDMEYAQAYARRHVRVSAEKILHIYDADRAQQTRGVPWMSTAIESLKMLHGYREAELVAARTGASKMGFFTSPQGDGFTADDYEDTFTPIMSAEPGTFHQLPAGVNFQEFNPSHPSTAFGEFERAVLRGIASGLGVSYYALANDLTAVSYSSIRAGELADRDFYKTLQTLMIQHFVEPVYRMWLTSVMTANRIPIPVTKYDKFAETVHFRGRGFPWVDPQREIQANILGISNGIMSMQDVANNYGRDIEETFEQIALEKQLAARYGIQLAFEPFGQKMQAPPTISGSAEPEARSQVNVKAPEVTEHNINVNPTVEVRHDPIKIDMRIDTEPKTKKRNVKLVRDENGAITGAEVEEK